VKALVEEALGLFDHRLGYSLIASADVQHAKAAGEIDEPVAVHVGYRSALTFCNEDRDRVEDGAWDCLFSAFEKLSGNGARNLSQSSSQLKSSASPPLLEVTSEFLA
jgi:hypothetical protein